MSSFPQHADNINRLKNMGFDVSEAYEDGEVSMDSWGYDELVYLMEEIIYELENSNFKLEK